MKIQLFLFTTLYVAISSYEITPIWKNNLLTTIPHWGKEYEVSFEVRPLTSFPQYANIIQFSNKGDCCAPGERIPGVWFQPKSIKLMISTALNNNGNTAWFDKKPLPLNKYTMVKIQQFQDNKGVYVYKIFINGKVVHQVINKTPKVFKNVKVYAGSPWYTAADAVLKNFQYTVEPEFTGNIKKGRLLQTLPVWGKEWRLRFQIKPLSAQKPWSNILHLTTGADNAALGSRIPAMWLAPNTMKLAVFTQIGNKKDWLWTSPKNLPIIKYTNVYAEQIKDRSGKYYFKIMLDGKQAVKVLQTKPTDYKNVKLYVSDPWYIHADAYLRNLHLEGISGSHHYPTL